MNNKVSHIADKAAPCLSSIHLPISRPDYSAEPVTEAQWILRDGKGNGVCSHCNRQDSIDPLATHCRYCGAAFIGNKGLP